MLRLAGCYITLQVSLCLCPFQVIKISLIPKPGLCRDRKLDISWWGHQKKGLKIELCELKSVLYYIAKKNRNFMKCQVTKSSSLCPFLSYLCIFNLSFSQTYSDKMSI